MTKFYKIFFAALLIILVQTVGVKANGLSKPGNLWINFATDAGNKNRQTPELKMSTSTTPGSKTTIVNYKIFGCRNIPILYNHFEYNQLEVGDCGFTSDAGNPKLPVRTIFLEFPDNHDYNVKLIGTKTSKIENIFLLPTQPAPPESGDSIFTINQQIYRDNAYYPAGRILSVKVVKLRERRLLEIRLTPVRFHPLQREVDFAHEIDLMVTFMDVGTEQ